MSGDAYDYFYSKLESFIDQLEEQDNSSNRQKFIGLLKLVVKACRDIEWVDSGDTGPGDEDEAIDYVFNFLKEKENESKEKESLKARKGNNKTKDKRT